MLDFFSKLKGRMGNFDPLKEKERTEPLVWQIVDFTTGPFLPNPRSPRDADSGNIMMAILPNRINLG